MDPDLIKEVYHWVPTPIVLAVAWLLGKRMLVEHERRMDNIVARVEAVFTGHLAHDKSIGMLVRETERHDRLIEDLQHESRDNATNIARLESYINGSGPKMNPLLRRRPPEDE